MVSPAGQYNFLQGGNPDLVPEESDTYTYGVILQPRFLPKLAMSIDYFDIEITDAVSTFGPLNAITACYENNDPLACDNIIRDPATGALWIGDGHVRDLNINTGGFETKGWDLSLTYSGVEMGRFGSLNFNLTGTLRRRAGRGSGRRLRAVRLCRPVQRRVRHAELPSGAITSASAGNRRGTSTCP